MLSNPDASSKYWQIDIDKLDQDKIGFTSHHGLYFFTRMFFGLRNTLRTFQGTIDLILFTVKLQSALLYLNDIVAFLKTPEEHICYMPHVLTLLNSAGATLKLKKCKIFGDTIDYLRYVIRPQRLEVASHTTDAICGIKALTSLTEL